MLERPPFSGRVVDYLQRRYIQQRLDAGTATENSDSEKVFAPLRTKGLFRGLPSAWAEARSIYGTNTETALFLSIGASEFFLTTAGIRLCKTDEYGNWEPLSNLLYKFIDRQMEKLFKV